MIAVFYADYGYFLFYHVYAPRETVMMKQAKEAGCEKVFNGMGMMLFQALIAIKLFTGKDTPVDYMKEKLGI